MGLHAYAYIVLFCRDKLTFCESADEMATRICYRIGKRLSVLLFILFDSLNYKELLFDLLSRYLQLYQSAVKKV